MRRLLIFLTIVYGYRVCVLAAPGPAQRVRGYSGPERSRTWLESIHRHRVPDDQSRAALLQATDHAGQPRRRVPEHAGGQWLASRLDNDYR